MNNRSLFLLVLLPGALDASQTVGLPKDTIKPFLENN